MPKEYWMYAFSTAVYLINRLLTPTLSMTSSFQIFFSTTPNYEKLKVFGSLCFPWLRPYNSHKLADRSRRCVFMGYSPTQSAYYCLDLSLDRIYTSRHVQFTENVFPFNTAQSKPMVESDHPTAMSGLMVTPVCTPPLPSLGPPSTSLHHHSPPSISLPTSSHVSSSVSASSSSSA